MDIDVVNYVTIGLVQLVIGIGTGIIVYLWLKRRSYSFGRNELTNSTEIELEKLNLKYKMLEEHYKATVISLGIVLGVVGTIMTINSFSSKEDLRVGIDKGLQELQNKTKSLEEHVNIELGKLKEKPIFRLYLKNHTSGALVEVEPRGQKQYNYLGEMPKFYIENTGGISEMTSVIMFYKVPKNSFDGYFGEWDNPYLDDEVYGYTALWTKWVRQPFFKGERKYLPNPVETLTVGSQFAIRMIVYSENEPKEFMFNIMRSE